MQPSEQVFDAYKLARTQAHLQGAIPLRAMQRLLRSLAASDGELRYEVQGRVDEHGHPGAWLTLSGELLLRCERCGEPMQFVLERRVPLRFVASEQELNALPLIDDEVEDVVVSGAISARDWVEDEAILSLPIVPRHADCAIPRGVAAIGSASEARTNPFAVLAGLKTGDNNGGPSDANE